MPNYARILSDLQWQRKHMLNELHRIETAIEALKSLNGAAPARTSFPRGSRISAAGRRRIAAAQRARWAKVRAGKSGK
jgi:hypothetical protein